MSDEHYELMQKLAMSLDTCLDLVAEKAKREKRAGEGKALRPVTWQDREKSFPALVDEAREALEDAGKPVFF